MEKQGQMISKTYSHLLILFTPLTKTKRAYNKAPEKCEKRVGFIDPEGSNLLSYAMR